MHMCFSRGDLRRNRGYIVFYKGDLQGKKKNPCDPMTFPGSMFYKAWMDHVWPQVRPWVGMQMCRTVVLGAEVVYKI